MQTLTYDSTTHALVLALLYGVWTVGRVAYQSLSGGPIIMTEQATVDDLTVTRDSEGTLVAQEADLGDITDEDGNPKTGRLFPLVYGDTVEYFDDGDDEGVEDLGADMVADILDTKLAAPDLTDHPRCPDSHVSEQFVREELPPLVPRSILMALFEVSGMKAEIEMNDDGSAEVDLDSEDAGN